MSSFDIEFARANFIETLFSTDIIKYQNQNEFGDSSWVESFSAMALIRWLELTLPLTVVTLALAIIFYRRSNRKRQHELGNLPMYRSDPEALLP